MAKEIRALTGLRGIAAFTVVLYHADINFGPVLGRIVRHGYLAVDLFFLLSGYVMAMTYGHLFARGGTLADYRRFLLLRAGRIYPLYLVVTLFCAAWFGAGRGPELIDNLLLIQSWGIARSLLEPGWSISTEAAAYLFFPLLALLCLHRGWRLAAGMGLLCAAAIPFIAAQPTSALAQALRNGPLDVYGLTMLPLLRCVAEFSLGMLSWRIMQAPRIATSAPPWAADAVALATLAALLIHGADVLAAALIALLIPLLALETSRTARFLAWRPVYWLGLISYSLYLVHRPVFQATSPPLLHLLGALHLPRRVSVANTLLVPVIVALAWATFVGIERPGRGFFRRLSARRLPPVPAVLAVSLAVPLSDNPSKTTHPEA